MARVIMTMIGLMLLGLGAWATYAWWAAVLPVLEAMVALGLLLVGLIVTIFGFSELAGARQAKPGPDSTPKL